MSTLTSPVTKISAVVFSALITLSFMDSVALGFQRQGQPTMLATLPAVTIIGHRADLVQDRVQTAASSDGTSSS